MQIAAWDSRRNAEARREAFKRVSVIGIAIRETNRCSRETGNDYGNEKSVQEMPIAQLAGNAVLAGMTHDLHLVGDRYEWLLAIFYITYVVFEFSLLLWKIFPPHRVAAVVVLCW